MKWVTAKLGDVTEVLSGSTPDSSVSKYWGGTHIWVTPTDLGKLDDTSIITSDRRITDEGLRDCNLPVIPAGSIVMSSRAPIGHIAFAGCELFTNQGCKSFVCGDALSSEFLFYALQHRMPAIQILGSGATFAEVSKTTLENYEISFPESLDDQEKIAFRLKALLIELKRAKKATQIQSYELGKLASSLIVKSLQCGKKQMYLLGDVLQEVKNGIGESWADYPVFGATRSGLAPAKEPPGKQPQRYKPVTPGTVFYNPMRILIGSVAFVDDDDEPGITSPDYVALTGNPGMVDSRWFYHWLKSPLGERCISSLVRGAVRERMLFNRLADGEIELPDFSNQEEASNALARIKPMRTAIARQMTELELMPKKLLAHFFEG